MTELFPGPAALRLRSFEINAQAKHRFGNRLGGFSERKREGEGFSLNSFLVTEIRAKCRL